MTGGLPPLVGLHGGWRRTGVNTKTFMEPSSNSPSVEHPSLKFCDSFRFFIVKTPDTFSNVSPFLIEKAFTSSIGEVKSIRKMRSGDLFLEASSAKQATALINLQKLAHLDITVAPHTTLNFSRDVISPADFLNVSTEEIKENMQAQNVCDVRRITIRRDGQVLNTKHLILTFNTPDLPQTVKMAYIRCPVRPYIPNPLRCFQCQRFGHSKTVCRGQPTCSRCAEARRVVSSRTPVAGKSYASATSKSYVSTAIQVDASTAPTSATAASITPKNVAVDTLKSVSPPRDVKKNRKTRIKESGCNPTKKRSNLSKNSMTWETMSWTFTPRKATKV
ncbi:uncharacterized protein TNCV_2268201 [Trichonephila clavipes]|nr:uncharacterized protein TNCV_2268201 [Trichonephila clavipes]